MECFIIKKSNNGDSWIIEKKFNIDRYRHIGLFMNEKIIKYSKSELLDSRIVLPSYAFDVCKKSELECHGRCDTRDCDISYLNFTNILCLSKFMKNNIKKYFSDAINNFNKNKLFVEREEYMTDYFFPTDILLKTYMNNRFMDYFIHKKHYNNFKANRLEEESSELRDIYNIQINSYLNIVIF